MRFAVIVLHRNVLEALHNLRKERVRNLGNDQPENPAASGNERPRLLVWIVAELLDDLPDKAGKLRRDRGNSADCA